MVKRFLGVATALLVAVAASAPASLSAQGMNDREGVERAALDYLEGFYEGSTEKIRRGVHPEVTKFGFAREDADSEYQRYPMSFDEMRCRLCCGHDVADQQCVRIGGETLPFQLFAVADHAVDLRQLGEGARIHLGGATRDDDLGLRPLAPGLDRPAYKPPSL